MHIRAHFVALTNQIRTQHINVILYTTDSGVKKVGYHARANN